MKYMGRKTKNNKKLPEQKVNTVGLISRADFLHSLDGSTHGGNRDMYTILGYKKEIGTEEYLQRYKRQDVAKRVIDAYPKACWAFEPEILDKEKNQEETPFEKQIKLLFKKKRIMQYLCRADILAGIGRYGVLFIGLKDGQGPDIPIQKGKYSVDDITFISPYMEKTAGIHEVGTDVRDGRYGLPVKYNIKTGTNPVNTLVVHHSRVLHIAEDLLEDDVYGTPRLESVINRFYDLEKVVGGSAETFYLNARGGLHVDSPADATIIDPDKHNEKMNDFINNLTRILSTKGMTINPIEFGIADPSANFATIMACIAGAKGIPLRILLGSEEGKLASGQDERNWAARVHERQLLFCEDVILRPFIDWCVNLGILPTPDNQVYTIKWKPLFTLTESEKADNVFKKSQALAQYASNPNASRVIGRKQYVEDWLDSEYRMPEGEAMTPLPETKDTSEKAPAEPK